MASIIRTGRVSAIDYQAGTYEVTYTDRGKSVTRQINAMSNGEYMMPEIGQIVSVSHNSNGTAAATTTGSIWNQSNKPAEGFRGLYRKEYSNKKGQAYERYDANTGTFTQYVDKQTGRTCNGEICDTAKGSIRMTAGGSIGFTAGQGIVLAAGGNVRLEAETVELNMNGTVVSISGDGGVTINGAVLSIDKSGNVSVTSPGKISMDAQTFSVSAQSLDMTAQSVNISGASGTVKVGGRTLQ